MENNQVNQGTNSAENGLSVDVAEKLFEQFYGKTPEEVKALENPAPEPTKEVATQETTQETVTPEPDKPAETVESKQESQQKDDDPYAWVNSINDETIKNKILEEIRHKLDAEHRFRSAQGRVLALQQETQNLSKKIASSKTKAPQAAKPDAASTSPRTAAEWEELIKSDPDLAKAVEARLDSRVSELEQRLTDKVNKLKESAIDPLYEHQVLENQRREMELLTQRVPNHQEIISSPEYSYWLQNLPEQVRDGVLRINNHMDAERALHMFASDMIRWGWDKASPFRQGVPNPPTSSTTAKPSSQPTDEAERVRKEREEKLKAQPVVTSTPTPVPVAKQSNDITLDDAQRLFEEYYKKRKAGERV